ncbi:hypothetical protein EUC06_20890 [Salmonella enterica subsp. enterica serovar Enteritidis]|nr:hypothetical protein [Salmonella enterica subsp. enterica serovar Enteritidis]EIJ8452191.1 hypothetical protein [Salmonella enterica]
MIDEKKWQARKHIEKVVEKYRSDDSRAVFHWVIKPSYKIPGNGYALGLVLAFVFLFGIGINLYDYGRYNGLVILLACTPLVLMFLFRIVTANCKYFQEKIWVNDEVSDEDILLLCENHDLRPLIKDEIEHGYKLTYTSLLEDVSDYLSRIEAYHAKIEKAPLIRKIDEII